MENRRSRYRALVNSNEPARRRRDVIGKTHAPAATRAQAVDTIIVNALKRDTPSSLSTLGERQTTERPLYPCRRGHLAREVFPGQGLRILHTCLCIRDAATRARARVPIPFHRPRFAVGWTATYPLTEGRRALRKKRDRVEKERRCKYPFRLLVSRPISRSALTILSPTSSSSPSSISSDPELQNIDIHVYIHIIYTHTYTYIYMYVETYIYIYVCMHVCSRYVAGT